MAKETTVARTPEDLQRRYRFKNIEITKEELDEFLDNLAFDNHLSSTSTNPVQNRTITLALASKVTAVSGKGLSTNDFTDSEKVILDQITQQKIDNWDSNTFSIDLVYPVGSIYLSTSSTNPGSLFTGTTWVQIKDKFLLSAGDTYTAGDTGGEATHTLTIDEIPSHNHDSRVQWNNSTGHAAPFIEQWNNNGNACVDNQNGLDGYRGGGQAHNNMPPYIVVYMWQRTA